MTRTEGPGRPTRPSEVERPRPDRAPAADSGLEIRSMREEDVAPVVEIERRSFSQPWEEDTFRRLLASDRARAWTAAADGVVGYVVLWTVGSGAQLGNLAVAPEARRRGVGRRLVRTALETARLSGADRVVLEVRESNRAAISLYHGIGFQFLGRREDYYRFPREDALVLGVDLR